MDYKKIGDLITNERKAKKMTQAKLAEKLFVSEKTVSKWENGNGIPDTNSLPKLCEIFGISLNELLSGERISAGNERQNDKLLLDFTKELESKNKIVLKSMWVIIVVSMFAMLGGVLLTKFLMPESIWQIITIIGICVVFLIPLLFALKLEVSVGAYKCKNCGCEFVPSYTKALFAMHNGTTRYLKCPECKKRTWCKKVLK